MYPRQKVAGVERGVARLLGIAKRAVHLVGYTSNGHIWVQQRSPGKAIDPGLWDTLVGGLIPETDNLTTALVRETWEEAGIRLNHVQQLRAGGHVNIRRPNVLDGGVGYVVEQIDWFVGVIPDWVMPINQDGEVAQFALLDPVVLKSQLERNLFTLDASLILSRYLSR
jgi:8-oxo-dGTP pyrophosphatase MutT (NUDIX family)